MTTRNLSKSDLVAAVALKLSLSKAVVDSVVDALTERVVVETAAGNAVAIRGFGTFKVKARPARQARNPRTGETVEVAPSSRLEFKAAKKAVV